MHDRKQISNSKSQSEIQQQSNEFYPVYRPSLIPNKAELDKIKGKGKK